MGYESIANKAEGRMGYWLRGHEGERNNCFSKIQLVGQNNIKTKHQMKIWSSHLLDNLSNCLMNLINSGDSTGFEPMTSAMPVQCSNQLSYEVTQWSAGQFVGLMFSRERNVIYMKECYIQCGVWNQMKIWSSHNLSKCWVTWIFQVHETIA